MGSGAGDQLKVGARVRPMVGVLDTLRSMLDELDPGQLPARDAMDLVTVLDRVGRVAYAGKMSAAVQVTKTSLWEQSGATSRADWLAKVIGVGVGDAVRLLKTAEAVAGAPETRDALARGEVSPKQAEVIAKAEKLSPEKGRDLLDKADRVSFGELRDESNQFVAAASPETDAEKSDRQHKARSLITGVDPDGMGWGHWRLPPAAHTRLLAQLESARSEIFRGHRQADDREASAAYRADALVQVAERAERTRTGSSEGDGSAASQDSPEAEESGEDWSFAKVIVRVDATALDRGELAEGEVCEIAGQGPVPVADAWRMIDGDAFVAALSTEGSEIGKVVHLGRKPTVLQRTALEWLAAGECSVEGCTSNPRLEIDHIADWADTGRTELSQITWPCGTHHDLKTHHGWTWGPLLPNGKRRLNPPEGEAGDDDAWAGPEPPGPPEPTAGRPDTTDALSRGPSESPPPDDHARAGPGPEPTPIADAPSVAERAQTLADRARARSAHPTGRRSPTRSAPGQDGLFDTG